MVDLQLQLSLVHSHSPWSRIEPRPGPEKPSSRLGHYHDQTCKMFLRFVVFLIWPEYIKLCSVYFNLVSNQYSDDKLERCQLLISSALFWRRSASPGLRLVSLFWFACHLNHNSISWGSTRESSCRLHRLGLGATESPSLTLWLSPSVCSNWFLTATPWETSAPTVWGLSGKSSLHTPSRSDVNWNQVYIIPGHFILLQTKLTIYIMTNGDYMTN